MKSKALDHIVLGIIALMMVSCGNKLQSDLSFEKQGKKITMVLENDATSLVVGKPTKARFDTENINNKKLSIVGAGIRSNQIDKDEFRFTITPIEKMLVDGKMKIHIAELLDNGEKFSHTFLVSVKLK
ncbi:hypothetical protein [uncultured Kordia sp.]|uniref:hypothetical protein n=1 Tax=uncultured Kordia sp. TaxID=507699 RepID=UPI00262D36F7|nr:hypothetical protein [uncultured Kordia sp.]